MKQLKEYINESKNKEYWLVLGVDGFKLPWETSQHISGICFEHGEIKELMLCIKKYGNVWIYKIQSDKTKREINDYFWKLKENYASQEAYEKYAIMDIAKKIIDKKLIPYEDIKKESEITNYINQMK